MIRAGIIGLGVGEAHIEGYHSHPGCQVTTICDFNPAVLKKISAKYPRMHATVKPDEILTNPDIDVVSIASYDKYHAEQIIKAINHNKHVFVEKPLCLYEKEAIQIKKRLDQHPHLKISSNLILRKSERFTDLKRRIGSNKMGELFYISGSYNYGRVHKITEGWRGKSGFYSVVYGGGVHIIDLFLWLTGAKVSEVFAYGNNITSKKSGFGYNDMVACTLKFDNGMVGVLSVNFGCVHPHFHQLEVYGTKATFINSLKNALYFDSRQKSEPVHLNTSYPGVKKGDLLRNFVDSILKKKEPEVTKKDVFDCMAVCFAIEKSAQKGKPVKVKYLTD